MGRVVKNALLVVGVLLLFLLLIIPARAERESWTLWTHGAIEVAPTTQLYIDATCTRAGLILQRHPVSDTLSVALDGYVATVAANVDYAEIPILALTPVTLTLTANVTQYVRGVSVECYDPRSASFYGAPPTPPPADLAAMTEAGGGILGSSTPSLLPMLIGLTLGMGIVVAIMRFLRWL